MTGERVGEKAGDMTGERNSETMKNRKFSVPDITA